MCFGRRTVEMASDCRFSKSTGRLNPWPVLVVVSQTIGHHAPINTISRLFKSDSEKKIVAFVQCNPNVPARNWASDIYSGLTQNERKTTKYGVWKTFRPPDIGVLRKSYIITPTSPIWGFTKGAPRTANTCLLEEIRKKSRNWGNYLSRRSCFWYPVLKIYRFGKDPSAEGGICNGYEYASSL